MKPQVRMYDAIIFDLDDTILDTKSQLVGPASREACEAMIAYGLNATPEECLAAREELLAENAREDVYSRLVHHFGYSGDPKAIAKAGYDAFYNREVRDQISIPLRMHSLLRDLSLDYTLFLVTSGSPTTQKTKVEKLEIANYFTQIFYVNPKEAQTKRDAFGKILSTLKVRPNRILCIGNRIDVEIAEAKELGITTCLVNAGEHTDLIPENSNEVPDLNISNLLELRDLCKV